MHVELCVYAVCAMTVANGVEHGAFELLISVCFNSQRVVLLVLLPLLIQAEGLFCQTSSMSWIEPWVSVIITWSLDCTSNPHARVWAEDLSVWRNGLHCHTSHALLSSLLPPSPGRSTPWRWTQTCSPWAAPPGSWTSGTPTGALSAPSTRPPYSEAGLPQPPLCTPLYFPLPLHPVLYLSLTLTHIYMWAPCLLTVMV